MGGFGVLLEVQGCTEGCGVPLWVGVWCWREFPVASREVEISRLWGPNFPKASECIRVN